MITGSFSLVGIQDAILVESCYIATQQNIAPSTPTSNNEDGSIPEGWSGTLISVSASMPYVWESQRTKDGSWSVWSTPILKNSWGKQGAKLRMRTWTENVVYLQGADGEEFYDVVVYNNKLYLCTKTHTSGSGNNPSASISGYLGYWESAQDWTFVATRLLLAEKISAEQIDADGLVAKNVDVTGKITATSGTFSNCVFNSLRSSDNSFVYDSNGLSISAEFSITAGNYTLKLEKQYADFLITDKSGRSLVRLAAFDDIQVASPSLRLSHPTSGNSAELNVSLGTHLVSSYHFRLQLCNSEKEVLYTMVILARRHFTTLTEMARVCTFIVEYYTKS